MKHLLIGICGYHNAGKTSLKNCLADELVDMFPAKVLAFSTGMLFSRMFAELVYGDALHIHETRKTNPIMRALLECYAKELIARDPQFVLDKYDSLLQHFKQPQIILLDGLRRLNEASWVRLHGGVVVKVNCPSKEDGILDTEFEIPQIEADFLVDNCGVNTLTLINAAKNLAADLGPRFRAMVKAEEIVK